MLHRAVTRKQKGSRNRKKAARTLGKAYRKVGHQRADTLHQVTTRSRPGHDQVTTRSRPGHDQVTTRRAKTKSVIVIEDLNVVGMLKNHHLAQAISAVGFAEFRRHLRYKAAWYGSRSVLASRPERRNACGEAGAGLSRTTQVKLAPLEQEPNTLCTSA